VSDDPRQPARRGEDGFTLAEVMVALALLLIGVLALLTMIEGSLSSTGRTVAREQATNLAREIVERSRQVPYASTTTTRAAAAIAATLPEHPAVTAGTFSVSRRNVTYNVTVTACSIDSPSDGAGVGDATFCDAPSSSSGPGSAPAGSGLALGPNILGIPVSLAVGGSLINTVCNAIGTGSPIIDSISSVVNSGALTSLLGNGARLEACPSVAGREFAFDTRPDDLRRIRVRVAWTPSSGDAGSLTQTTLLTTPG
jgi:prepilin-type N-terminal cleavage/methylation domain-containing protein